MENETTNSPEESLVGYVTKLVQSGATKAEIKDQLSAVGWSEAQADEAYSKALISNGVPVPSEAMQSTFGKKSSTVEIALNLFSFVLLAIVATAVGTLFYQIINKYFPDQLVTNYYRNNRVATDAIHYAIAALVIAFPLYYTSMRLWFRGFKRDQGKIETKLTKWLTYLVLLVASIAIVGDLIVTVFAFLQGELSVRFFLKALTIFAIFGAIFGFYFLERKKIQYRKEISQSVFRIFGIVVSIIIIFGIVLGFVAGGSPATERKRGFDDQREGDLSSVSNCVERYAKEYKRLPASLEEMQKSSSYSYCVNKKDPETGELYEYSVVTASKNVGTNKEGEFELCATFSLKSEEDITTSKSRYSYDNINWNDHEAGKDCKKRTVVLDTQINQIIPTPAPAPVTTPTPAPAPTPTPVPQTPAQ